MNITDVGHLMSDADEGEDKIEREARRTKKSAWDIARFYEDVFKKDIAALTILPPDIWCRATEHIEEQIAVIKKLEKNGYTYRVGDGIYFDTSKFRGYGKLAEKNIKGIKAGARVGQGEKRHATDFTLWKFADPAQKRQMIWDSPWGKGFPGWHLECSAMSMKYLGETIDIHCGGIDHIQIHHTNEIAQSEGATKKSFVRYWIHGNFLIMGDKMSKSLGNTVILKELKERGFDPLDFRYFTFTAHYRSPLVFSWRALQAAAAARQNLTTFLQEMRSTTPDKMLKKTNNRVLATYQARFQKAVNDDLALPTALSVLWELIAAARRKPHPPFAAVLNTIFWFDHVLGLNLKHAASEKEIPPPEIEELAREREKKRATGDFAAADALRKQIQKLGWQINDTLEGPKISRM